MEHITVTFCQAIPDTKLTIKKYADVKFEYLSYCLKVFAGITNVMITGY